MRQISTLVLVALFAVVCSQCKKKITTYGVKGDITVVNDCSGNGADNDASVDVTVKFYYKPDTARNPGVKTATVAMVLQPDGVTTKGSYDVDDVPTNQVLHHIEVEIEKQCNQILCPLGGGNCTDMATNTPSNNIAPGNPKATYDYRFSCTCVGP